MSNKRSTNKTTTFEALLGILSMGPMTGYEIRQRIEESIGNFWNESFGQIYPALAKLHKQGLVKVEAAGKAGRKVYSLTPAGHEHLKAWLAVMPMPRKPRNETLLKLFFGNLGDVADTREQVLATRERFAADIQRYTALEPELRERQSRNPGLPYYRLTLNYGLAEARAVVSWADETLAALDKMTRQKIEAKQGESL